MKVYYTWKASRRRMGSHRCIEFLYEPLEGVSDVDYCLASKYGIIWPHSATIYSCIVQAPKVASRVALLLQASTFEGIVKGEEAKFSFSEDMLDKVVKLLKIPSTRPSQAKMANRFGK